MRYRHPSRPLLLIAGVVALAACSSGEASTTAPPTLLDAAPAQLAPDHGHVDPHADPTGGTTGDAVVIGDDSLGDLSVPRPGVTVDLGTEFTASDRPLPASFVIPYTQRGGELVDVDEVMHRLGIGGLAWSPHADAYLASTLLVPNPQGWARTDSVEMMFMTDVDDPAAIVAKVSDGLGVTADVYELTEEPAATDATSEGRPACVVRYATNVWLSWSIEVCVTTDDLYDGAAFAAITRRGLPVDDPAGYLGMFGDLAPSVPGVLDRWEVTFATPDVAGDTVTITARYDLDDEVILSGDRGRWTRIGTVGEWTYTTRMELER